MISLKIARQATLDFVGRLLGTRSDAPVHFEAQRRAVGRTGEIKNLPLRPMQPDMILDPDDANFGKFKFVAGVSEVDGGDIYS